MGRRSKELKFPFSNMFAVEGSSGITAIENHQLVAARQPEAGSDIVEEGSRITVPIILKLPTNSRYQPKSPHPLLSAPSRLAKVQSASLTLQA